MANAIKKISVQRGYDITRYVLNVFGGAGGQHACAVADALGMTRVLIHPLAGVLSAYGMGLADIVAMREQAVEAPLSAGLLASCPRPWTRWKPMPAPRWRKRAGEWVAGVPLPGSPPPAGPTCATTAPTPRSSCRSARWPGCSRPSRPSTPGASPSSCATRPIVVEAVSVEVTGTQENLAHGDHGPFGRSRTTPRPAAGQDVRRRGLGRRGPAAQGKPRPGRSTAGPAIIAEDFATTVVEPGWQATVTEQGDLLLERVSPRPGRGQAGTEADPVLLEIFNNLFMSVAEQMGVRLQATAHSVNIKERLDFSCALFDAAGGLIANAPHMPVHLGSMGESIKMVISRNPHIRRGDVYVLNDPYHGGTHLPDVTVVTPVFAPDRATSSGSTWPRAGTTPRSAASRPGPCPRPAPGSRKRAC